MFYIMYNYIHQVNKSFPLSFPSSFPFFYTTEIMGILIETKQNEIFGRLLSTMKKIFDNKTLMSIYDFDSLYKTSIKEGNIYTFEMITTIDSISIFSLKNILIAQ